MSRFTCSKYCYRLLLQGYKISWKVGLSTLSICRISAGVLFEVYRKTYRVPAVQNVGHVTSIRFRLCVGPETVHIVLVAGIQHRNGDTLHKQCISSFNCNVRP